MDKEQKIQLRNKIRKALVSEQAFGGVYNNVSQYEKAQPSDVKITDETWGVMDYKFDPKQMQNVDFILDKLQPYFDDIEVKYIGTNEDSDNISINVKNKYKNLLDALMIHSGFNKDVETWGDEMRSGKRVFTTRGGTSSGGTHGNFPMPILLGEYPSGGGFY